MADTDRKVFIDDKGVIYPFGVGAAGRLAYFGSDLPLTGSLVRQFAFDAEINVGYDFDALLLVDVAVAGAVTINAGITGGSPLVRLVVIPQLTATATEHRNTIGTGAQSVTTSSLSTTGPHSVLVRGSALKTTAGGILFLDMSTAGTMTLLAGSTFRVWRTN